MTTPPILGFQEEAIDDGSHDQIAGLLAGITGWPAADTGWAFIAIRTDKQDPRENMRIFANTSERRQVIALMHLALFGMTVKDLAG